LLQRTVLEGLLVHMLVQLRMAVASLQHQGLWRAGKGDRPPSRAKVGGVVLLWLA
jgi:hypothetical protein